MPKTFEIRAGEKRRILWIFSSSIPGTVRFRAESLDGTAPEGKVLLERRRWFDWHRDEQPLHARNVFDKGVSDADYRITVTPARDTRIVFETRHFRAGTLFTILVVMLALGVLAPLTIMLITNLAG